MADEGERKDGAGREGWEEEVLVAHRWGRHGGERAEAERMRLRALRDRVAPWEEAYDRLVEQVRALEICNWDLEESFVALCEAVGAKRPTSRPIGHLPSVTPDRWRELWAYYLALRDWLPREIPAGYGALLEVCDADGAVRQHVGAMLGEWTELKGLFVERFCCNIAFWLGGVYDDGEKPQLRAHDAAAAALEKEIRRLGGDEDILEVMAEKGDGIWLGPCHHKTFRRYDIIISSIGAGKWRGAMPRRGTDGFARAETVEKYTAPAEAWVAGRRVPNEAEDAALFGRIAGLLGRRDDAKVFLVSLLVSLLRAQQLAAVKRAEGRAKASPAGPPSDN